LYGAPKTIVSDNAKYFKSANDALKRIWHKVLNDEQTKAFRDKHLIDWKFIPEYSPWMGGFYERLVKIVKECLKKILGKKCTTFVELQTILAEICTIVNSRPLVLENGIDDPIITPSRLLGKLPSGGFLPSSIRSTYQVTTEYEPKRNKTRTELINLWNKKEAALNLFWDMWKRHYLNSLRERSQVGFKNRNTVDVKPAVNDVVIIQSDLPRNQWKMGIITKVFRSNDGFCRSASVRLPNGKETIRPIRFLYPLEISPEHETTHNDDVEAELATKANAKSDSESKSIPRQPRRAAEHARRVIQQQLNSSDSEYDN
jgi:hypothetical protein